MLFVRRFCDIGMLARWGTRRKSPYRWGSHTMLGTSGTAAGAYALWIKREEFASRQKRLRVRAYTYAHGSVYIHTTMLSYQYVNKHENKCI